MFRESPFNRLRNGGGQRSKTPNNRHRMTTRQQMNDRLLNLAKHKRFDKLFSVLIQEYGDIQQVLCVEDQSVGVQRDNQEDLNKVDRLVTPSRNRTTRTVVSSIQSSLQRLKDDDKIQLVPNTLLHEVLAHRPPFAIVDVICGLLSEQSRLTMTNIGEATGHQSPEDFEDNQCRKPIHVAVLNGCDYDVVKRLMKGESHIRPVMTIDDHGRTPLHWACANPLGVRLEKDGRVTQKKGFAAFTASFRLSKENQKHRIENMVKIVEMLVYAYPKACMMKDQTGLYPVDIARHFKASPKIILALLDASRKIDESQRIMVSQDDSCAYITTTTSTMHSNSPRSHHFTMNGRRIKSDRTLAIDPKDDELDESVWQKSNKEPFSPRDMVIEYPVPDCKMPEGTMDDDISSLGSLRRNKSVSLSHSLYHL